MAESLYGTHKMWNPIIKDKGLTEDDFEEVRLATQATPNSAIVGDLVVYDVADELDPTDPITHKDVILAATISADAQVPNHAIGWSGQIIEPMIVPDPVAGVAWSPSVALLDGTMVKMLKKGANATTAMVIVDESIDVHTGEGLCIATVGAIKSMINTLTDTTPTVAELALILIQSTLEYVGRAAEISEDAIHPGQEGVVFVDWSGY